jgi:acetoin utilization deacetylase AcuC-like enzyme
VSEAHVSEALIMEIQADEPMGVVAGDDACGAWHVGALANIGTWRATMASVGSTMEAVADALEGMGSSA